MAASKTGWWIKIRLDKTECQQITFSIGTRKEDRRFWRNWSQGEENEFDVPADYRDLARLYIYAAVQPEGKNGWFCMMYKGDGVKHFDFDRDEDHERGQDDRDSECR